MVEVVSQRTIEEGVVHLGELTKKTALDAVESFRERFDISWVYHDSALEGVVYNFTELKAAIDDQVISDNSLLPTYDEIRQHKAAIDLIRELAAKKKLELSLDIIKKIYLTLIPEEDEGKGSPKYRKEMPVHRLYFHEISQPDKISPKMRQLIQWVNAPETKRTTHPIRLASKTQHTLLQIYPFTRDSGKVARLVMNLMLMNAGYPPAIVHSTERQRYYEALKTSSDAVAALVHEALQTSLESGIRYFEEIQARKTGHSSRSA